MNSVGGTAALPAVGFPIRTSPDQSLVSGSPTLFAATHVLLRLLSPRHPSCALCSLVIVSRRSPSDQKHCPWMHTLRSGGSRRLHRQRRRKLRTTKTRVQRGVVNHRADPQHLPTCA